MSIFSSSLQSFCDQIKYTINRKHDFVIEVRAKIEPVKLTLSRQKIKLTFQDDNLEMSTKETLTIQNNGNARAEFEFIGQATQEPIFAIEPRMGAVEAQSTFNATVSYKPNWQSGNLKYDEAKFQFRVKGGSETVVHIQGQVNDIRCALVQESLDIGLISVHKSVESAFRVKNQTRNSTILHITEQPS